MTTDLVTSLAQDDTRPLPLIVAEKWDFPLQHYQRFDVEGGYVYALQDWAIGLVGKSGKPAMRDFKDSEVCARLVEIFFKLPYKATNGRNYQMDFCTDKALYIFAQYVRLGENREILIAIRRYLADAGVLVDEMRREAETSPVPVKEPEPINWDDPEALFHAGMEKWRKDGKSEGWVYARIQGIATRKRFTDALRNAVLYAPRTLYSEGTDRLYVGLWKRTTEQLRNDLELNQTTQRRPNVRDHFGQLALTYTDLAEQVATIRLGDAEMVDMKTAMKIVYEAARLISKQAQATSKALRIDLVTERPLLAKGK